MSRLKKHKAKIQRVRYKTHKPLKGMEGFNVRSRTVTTTCRHVDEFPPQVQETISELIELGYNIQMSLFNA